MAKTPQSRDCETVKLWDRFKPKLQKSVVFEDYEWEFPEAKKSQKTNRWDFQYNAKPYGYNEY